MLNTDALRSCALLGSRPTAFCCFCIIYFSESWQQSVNSWEGWPEQQTNTNHVILLYNISLRKSYQLIPPSAVTNKTKYFLLLLFSKYTLSEPREITYNKTSTAKFL